MENKKAFLGLCAFGVSVAGLFGFADFLSPDSIGYNPSFEEDGYGLRIIKHDGFFGEPYSPWGEIGMVAVGIIILLLLQPRNR